jgi:hypothetical protein
MPVNNEDQVMNNAWRRNISIIQLTAQLSCSSVIKGRISIGFRVFLFRAQLDQCYNSTDSAPFVGQSGHCSL